MKSILDSVRSLLRISRIFHRALSGDFFFVVFGSEEVWLLEDSRCAGFVLTHDHDASVVEPIKNQITNIPTGRSDLVEPEQRDWVISETGFGAMGEREKMKVRAQLECETISAKKDRNRQKGKVGCYHHKKMGGLVGNNPNENDNHLSNSRRGKTF